MTTQQKIIKNKSGLLEPARMLGNVSQARKVIDSAAIVLTASRNSTIRAASRR